MEAKPSLEAREHGGMSVLGPESTTVIGRGSLKADIQRETRLSMSGPKRTSVAIRLEDQLLD